MVRMAALAMTAAMALASSNPSAGSIEGHWMHPEQTVIIRLENCGDEVCGTVTWATERAQRDARKGVDRLIGARLLTGFQQNKKGIWKGRIFVPDYDLRVSGKIQPLDANRLKVSGCALGGLLCRTQVWKRSDGPVVGSD
jgi:uncharacterized protein (DUF2147 family)